MEEISVVLSQAYKSKHLKVQYVNILVDNVQKSNPVEKYQ